MQANFITKKYKQEATTPTSFNTNSHSLIIHKVAKLPSFRIFKKRLPIEFLFAIPQPHCAIVGGTTANRISKKNGRKDWESLNSCYCICLSGGQKFDAIKQEVQIIVSHLVSKIVAYRKDATNGDRVKKVFS